MFLGEIHVVFFIVNQMDTFSYDAKSNKRDSFLSFILNVFAIMAGYIRLSGLR